MGRRSKRIVIDASIANAAGGSEHPVSRSCRDFLLQVLEVCHHAVMTPSIREEWKEHQSKFTSTWLTSMYARKKVCSVVAAVEPTMADKLGRRMGEKDREALRKDLLLLEAALETDALVASLDEKARSLFKGSAGQWGKIKPIAWVNPSREKEHPLQWLAAGAKPEKERLLGYVAKQSS